MLKLTMKQWNETPNDKKGRVSHAVRFLPPNGSRMQRAGRQNGRAVQDRQFLGARTLKMGKLVLVEGLGFVITDDSLV